MRRGFLILALSLVLYAAALVAGQFAICEASDVIDAIGEWATHRVTLPKFGLSVASPHPKHW